MTRPTKVGFAFRRQYREGLLGLEQDARAPEVLELMAESFDPRLPGRVHDVAALRERYALIGHAVGLSVGSVERPPAAYVEGVARFLELVQPSHFSDHVAITWAGGRDFGHLTPIVYCERSLEQVVDNLLALRSVLGILPALEIIAEPFVLPELDWDQGRFVSELHRATGCKIHLDVTNVHINAHNFGFCPRAFIAALPAEAIELMHVVGYGRYDEHELADTHDQDIQPELWSLVEYALARVRPAHVIIERDGNFPSYAAMLGEVERLRSLVEGAPA
ncbi:DUF692 domain-containing protein [Nannocystaceae bacterium ST9]